MPSFLTLIIQRFYADEYKHQRHLWAVHRMNLVRLRPTKTLLLQLTEIILTFTAYPATTLTNQEQAIYIIISKLMV
ncbi:hypothetical protein HMPREF1544_11705 [Mucor circinelloides 1006PhL]|uniref:Uncharacterized protein n=1 Tax=Mucor circinelloides f. circinelloides (strain 1006PhL) TaxID=1220926 RepID=S2IV67_MUCC1|nr:hypothetical protein HMPREF1544_11705 [Mucor circinelloides 1006PhL]